jgi:hypothetical protein
MSLQDYSNQIKRLKKLIESSKGSLDLDRVIKLTGFNNVEMFTNFYLDSDLQGLTINWDTRKVIFDQNVVTVAIDSLLQSFDKNSEKETIIERPNNIKSGLPPVQFDFKYQDFWILIVERTKELLPDVDNPRPPRNHEWQGFKASNNINFGWVFNKVARKSKKLAFRLFISAKKQNNLNIKRIKQEIDKINSDLEMDLKESNREKSVAFYYTIEENIDFMTLNTEKMDELTVKGAKLMERLWRYLNQFLK